MQSELERVFSQIREALAALDCDPERAKAILTDLASRKPEVSIRQIDQLGQSVGPADVAPSEPRFIVMHNTDNHT